MTKEERKIDDAKVIKRYRDEGQQWPVPGGLKQYRAKDGKLCLPFFIPGF